MRRQLHHLVRQAAATSAALLLVLALLVWAAPPPVAQASVSPGGAFGSAVPCLTSTDQFAVTRYDNTVFGATAPASYPALQTIVGGGITTQAFLSSIGSVYGLAYDDGAASGRERLFVGAYTKRLVAYGPQGAGGIYIFERSGANWALTGSFAVPGAVGVTHSGAGSAPVDRGALAGVGTTALGGMAVSPDGTTLYVVNVGARRLERFVLTSAVAPTHSASIPINFSSITTDASTLNDLTAFALAWYQYPLTTGEPVLLVGVTDTARRGINLYGGVESEPKMTGPNFTVSPSIHILVHNPTTGGWGRFMNLDLGNNPAFTTRHSGSGFASWTWTSTQTPYTVRGWNPWRNQLASIAGRGYEMHYPQPLLTEILFVREEVPTATNPQPRGMLVLGIRDRTGDMAFNGGITVPAGERSAIAQGDTVALRWNGSGYALVATDHYNDNAMPFLGGGATAHIENHEGALARIPGTGTNVGNAGDTLVGTTLGGDNNQGLRTWVNTAGVGGLGAYTNLIDAASHAATKASNLGDVEVLCSYALVGGRVWNDTNGDSIQNGADAGIAGVTLELFRGNSPLTAPTLATATTDALGRYLFAIPPNLNLNIRISAASRTLLRSQGYRTYTRENVAGSSDTNDSDASQLWGYLEFARPGQANTSSAIVPPWRESDGRSYDIGLTRYQPSGRIGNRVWSDTNGNGVQDAGETGVSGVSVSLEGVDTATLGTIAASTMTDGNGTYLFDFLPPGRYRVRFAVPAGMRATLSDRGGDDTRDSDADAASGYYTVQFDLAESQWRDEWDFGLIANTDVAIAKSGPITAAAGQDFSYTLTARNRTANQVDGVVVADTLPAGLVYVSASPAPTSRSGQSLTWSLGALAGNGSRAITVNVRAPLTFTPATAVAQSIANCASVTTTPPDSNPDNNSACASTELDRPEVGIVKAGPAAPVLVGDEFAYTLAYANNGRLPAANVVLSDTLPAGLTFVRFIANPLSCASTATTVSCGIASLAPGAGGSISFVVRSDVATVGASATNVATISTETPGDSPGNNTSSTTTAIQLPNPGVTLRIDPRPLPVGEPGQVTVTYRNIGTGLARTTALTITHEPGVSIGPMPAGCSHAAAARRVVCALGDLPSGHTGTVVLPLRLPATPEDAATFSPDSFGVTAEIGSATPERVTALADNTDQDRVDVVRPNVYVTAGGPDDSVRLAWGSGFVYEVAYGNRYAAHPDLTREAAGSVLTVTLPADVEFLAASVAPASVSGRVLVWQLATLAPRAAAGLRIAVRTAVPAGTLLHMEAVISTVTRGDDPSDNRATVDTTVVRPPDVIPAPEGVLRLAIHSDLDPRHSGSDEHDAVYLTPRGATGFVWPAGEVLDFTPRLDGYSLEEPGWPLEHRARVVGWSLAGVEINGRVIAPTAADSRGRAGCRPGDAPALTPKALAGCAYAYVGARPEGRTLSDFLPMAALREPELAGQAHIYWTQPPAPPMRDDVYLYTVSPLAPVRLTVEVEVEVWVVNACPDFLIDPLGACGAPIELPTPPHAAQIVRQMFDVTLLVPRSVVGPGQ